MNEISVPIAETVDPKSTLFLETINGLMPDETASGVLTTRGRLNKEGKRISGDLYADLLKQNNSDFGKVLSLCNDAESQLNPSDLDSRDVEVQKIIRSIRGKTVYNAHRIYLENKLSTDKIYGASAAKVFSFSKAFKEIEETDVYKDATRLEQAKNEIDQRLDIVNDDLEHQNAEIIALDVVQETSNVKLLEIQKHCPKFLEKLLPPKVRRKLLSAALSIVSLAGTIISPFMHSSDGVANAVAAANSGLDTQTSMQQVLTEPLDFNTISVPSFTNDYLSSTQEIPVVPEQTNPVAEKVKVEHAQVNITDLEKLTFEKKTDFTGVFVTGDNSQVLKIPISSDFFRDDSRTLTVELLASGMSLAGQDIYYFTNPKDSSVFRFSILPHTTNTKYVPILLLDQGYMDETGYHSEFLYAKIQDQQSASSYGEATYMANYQEVYTNKVYNILTALDKLNEYQNANGGFKAGQTYSYLDIIGLRNPSDFLPGRNSAGQTVLGGGVCAVATTLSESIYYASQRLGIPWKSVVAERWEHPAPYFQGPFASQQHVTDATVSLSENGDEFDFKWVQPADGYFKIDLSLLSNGHLLDPQSQDGLGSTSGLDIAATISMVPENPGDQSQAIAAALAKFSNGDLNNNTNEAKYTSVIGNEALLALAEQIYPHQNTPDFVEELSSNSGYLHNIVLLQAAINSISEGFEGSVVDYLRNTDWYKEVPKSDKLEAALKSLDYTKVKGQPVQCFGFVNLLASIGFEELPSQEIGGAQSFGDGATPAHSATELIPTQVYKGTMSTSSTGYGGVAISSDDLNIEDFRVGDLFVRPDVGYSFTVKRPDGTDLTIRTGHVGIVLGKKVNADGETVLLVADANRNNDGRIQIFEVSKANYQKILVTSTGSDYIIRSSRNS